MVTTYVWPPPTPNTVVVQESYIKRDGWQSTVSTETPFPWYHNPKVKDTALGKIYSKVDFGSNFLTSKTSMSGGQECRYIKITGNATQRYKGHVLPWIPLTSELGVLPGMTPTEKSQLISKGSTAIARCIPTNPVSGLSNFLGELKRDGFPKRPGESMRKEFERGKTLSGFGSEYLNFEFAMRPFMSDVRSFANVVKNHDKVLKQYLRDSGRTIRRRYEFPTESTVVSSTISSAYYPQGGNLPASWFNSGVLTKEVRTTSKVWFSGAFCYHLNFDDSVMAKLRLYEQKANKLLGIRLTPKLIWDLTPWSWAADWVANYGDVFHNVSAFLADGLVMRHGYVMEHKTITTTYTLPGYTAKVGTDGGNPPLKFTITQERKVRLKASPFGFGLVEADLSLRQKAIIAALGISRSARQAK